MLERTDNGLDGDELLALGGDLDLELFGLARGETGALLDQVPTGGGCVLGGDLALMFDVFADPLGKRAAAGEHAFLNELRDRRLRHPGDPRKLFLGDVFVVLGHSLFSLRIANYKSLKGHFP